LQTNDMIWGDPDTLNNARQNTITSN